MKPLSNLLRPPHCKAAGKPKGVGGYFAFGIVLMLAACSVNPTTGDKQFTAFMSPEQENIIGAQEHEKILQAYGGVYDDPRLNAWINQVGWSLAPHTERPGGQYVFTVLDTDIVNAFALPGGYVYITRGLLALAYDEAEVAGVLAHEMGHVNARHSAERYSQQVLAQLGLGILAQATDASALAQNLAGLGASAYLQRYSRTQEYEADELGVRYLKAAGYDPYAMADFLTSLEAHARLEADLTGNSQAVEEFSIFQSHPRTSDRVVRAVEQVGDAAQISGKRGRLAYLRAIDGMSYHGSRRQGFVRNQAFVHPTLGFRFDVPNLYHVVNTTTRVALFSPEEVTVVFDTNQLDHRQRQRGNALKYLTGEWLGSAALRNVRTFGADGFTGATALTGTRDNTYRAAVIAGDHGVMYRFLFKAPKGSFERLDPGFVDMMNSFRRLSADEQFQAQPLKIMLIKVEEGDNAENLSRYVPPGPERERRFRTLNGINHGQNVQNGWIVKGLR